ncbi:MAG: hypothetical protein RL207_1312 [Bacteroidota bacterium]|jgi:hypothetical protein
MSAQERFNHVTGRKEFYIKPNNLPGYWTALGLCDRCYLYQKCLGLARLSKDEWAEFIISQPICKQKRQIGTIDAGHCTITT